MNALGKAAAVFSVASILTGAGYGVLSHSKNAELEAYRGKVTVRLRDPTSAQFRDDIVVPDGEGKAYCGAVNAKNSFGGYAGFQYFVVTDADVLFEPPAVAAESRDVEAMERRRDFLIALKTHCAAAFGATTKAE